MYTGPLTCLKHINSAAWSYYEVHLSIAWNSLDLVGVLSPHYFDLMVWSYTSGNWCILPWYFDLMGWSVYWWELVNITLVLWSYGVIIYQWELVYITLVLWSYGVIIYQWELVILPWYFDLMGWSVYWWELVNITLVLWSYGVIIYQWELVYITLVLWSYGVIIYQWELVILPWYFDLMVWSYTSGNWLYYLGTLILWGGQFTGGNWWILPWYTSVLWCHGVVSMLVGTGYITLGHPVLWCYEVGSTCTLYVNMNGCILPWDKHVKWRWFILTFQLTY